MLANVYAELKFVQERPQDWQKQREVGKYCGGLEDTSLEDAQNWLSLLAEGISGLQDDILDPPDNPYVLFHDDFQLANIVVSADNPSKVVGLLDWEGSRICPVWDNRRLCGNVGLE